MTGRGSVEDTGLLMGCGWRRRRHVRAEFVKNLNLVLGQFLFDGVRVRLFVGGHFTQTSTRRAIAAAVEGGERNKWESNRLRGSNKERERARVLVLLICETPFYCTALVGAIRAHALSIPLSASVHPVHPMA